MAGEEDRTDSVVNVANGNADKIVQIGKVVGDVTVYGATEPRTRPSSRPPAPAARRSGPAFDKSTTRSIGGLIAGGVAILAIAGLLSDDSSATGGSTSSTPSTSARRSPSTPTSPKTVDSSRYDPPRLGPKTIDSSRYDPVRLPPR
ncbi:hypothetical protein [Amycolatopsis sp. NPDC059021]|uniref:hypothetical protein n=1 Tax=Amycolatopsis sp. NPDC059021 TaxID=3346704 RepID=UPI00366D49AA